MGLKSETTDGCRIPEGHRYESGRCVWCDAEQNKTTRKPGDVIDFPGTGRVTIQFVEDGQIFFASWKDGEDDPWLARMTFDDFEGSLRMTQEKLSDGR